MKELIIARLLLIFFGWLGLHHLYLGRYKQAVLWSTTFGGFVLGWIRDFWRLSDYVNSANQILPDKTGRPATPPFSIIRFCGEIAVGTWYGFMVRLVLRDMQIMENGVSVVLQLSSVAFGVYLVGSVNPQKININRLSIFCVLSLIIFGNKLFYSALLFAVFVNWYGKAWDDDNGSYVRPVIRWVNDYLLFNWLDKYLFWRGWNNSREMYELCVTRILHGVIYLSVCYMIYIIIPKLFISSLRWEIQDQIEVVFYNFQDGYWEDIPENIWDLLSILERCLNDSS